jgi:hypothetical protein
MRVCGLVNKGGIAFRCKSEIRKTPKLRFHVLLTGRSSKVELALV